VSVSALDQLDERAAERARVQEGDQVTAGAGAWCAVDELDAGALEARQRRGDVAHRERDVVERVSSLGDELLEPGVPRHRADQLDGGAAVRQAQERGGGALRGDVLVLEEADAAKARGAKILGYVLGCGERGDGFHRTRSSPDGAPIVAAMREAIEDAGLTADDIDYVNAHGTGTPENDKMESMGCAAVIGERMKQVPISSNKSMIGHTLTAAGAVEAVMSLLTIASGRIPPTINYRVPDPAIPLDVVPNDARDARVDIVLSNSFGFGGQNTCLVMGAEPKGLAS
jgi:hypothetical protein